MNEFKKKSSPVENKSGFKGREPKVETIVSWTNFEEAVKSKNMDKIVKAFIELVQEERTNQTISFSTKLIKNAPGTIYRFELPLLALVVLRKIKDRKIEDIIKEKEGSLRSLIWNNEGLLGRRASFYLSLLPEKKELNIHSIDPSKLELVPEGDNLVVKIRD